MQGDLMQIGEVAQRTGLSLRTIRYYEEVDLVAPSARTQGGFRLYTEADAQRLCLVKRMKPLDFNLGEMRELLALLDGFELHDARTNAGTRTNTGTNTGTKAGAKAGAKAGSKTGSKTGTAWSREVTDRLEMFRADAESRCATLRARLASAEQFAADLEQTLARGGG